MGGIMRFLLPTLALLLLASCSRSEHATPAAVISSDQAVRIAKGLLYQGHVIIRHDGSRIVPLHPILTSLGRSLHLVYGDYPYIRRGDNLSRPVWIVYIEGDYSTTDISSGVKLEYHRFSVVLDAEAGDLTMLTAAP